MATSHFICLLVFVAWSCSSLGLANGGRVLLAESANHECDEQALLLPFKKFPMFKFKPFVKPFFKPFPYKHKFKFPPKFKLPPREITNPVEDSMHDHDNKQVSNAGDVHDEKFLPFFKFKFKFPPKFIFPKKKFFPKFKLPPIFPPKVAKITPLDEEAPKPIDKASSTMLPRNSGFDRATTTAKSVASVSSATITTKPDSP